MFQSPGYPGGFPSGAQMPPPQYPQGAPEMRPGMFNPNVPSSSRTGPMTSSAGYMPMGHPNMNGQMMYPQQQPMQIQQHPQMAQMMPPNNGQWSQGPQQGMYHPQQMYYNNGGQRPPPGYMGPPQVPQQPQVKKASKRKSATQRNQESQQSVAAMIHMQQAATSQQGVLQQGTQPPVKQQFLNPMNGFPNGSPQFSGPNTPMNPTPMNPNSAPMNPTHLSPYHQNPQQPQHYDWSKSGPSVNGARPNSRSEHVKAEIRASIQAKQHSSPQQMSAMMSPNDIQQGRFISGTASSISPPTMMSPPRINQGPHPGHASQNYGPPSIPQPSSIQNDQTNIFSPKNQFYNGNGYAFQQNHIPQMIQPQMNVVNSGFKSQFSESSMLKDFPVLSLEDCKEILQESDFAEFDLVGFDNVMINKQGQLYPCGHEGWDSACLITST
ncbi:hypothetical protein FO519_006059 [Halicephalobus sp. NKZ332]|nr:hypothetical protein FO519_006059 [Halicephalobus sp. NKZ332]